MRFPLSCEEERGWLRVAITRLANRGGGVRPVHFSKNVHPSALACGIAVPPASRRQNRQNTPSCTAVLEHRSLPPSGAIYLTVRPLAEVYY